MSEIREIQEVIRNLHGTDSTHEESVPVTETFSGRTVWDGVVEVFKLHGHPEAPRVYAWAYNTDDNKRKVITVLHTDLVSSPVLAVRAFIVQEFRNRGFEN